MNPVSIDAESLRQFCVACFTKSGMRLDQARMTADNSIFANLPGVDSHGVIRLKIYCDRLKAGGFRSDVEPEGVSESISAAVIDGHGGIGQVTAMRAMKLAVEKAEKSGAAFVTTRNSNHFGACAF